MKEYTETEQLLLTALAVKNYESIGAVCGLLTDLYMVKDEYTKEESKLKVKEFQDKIMTNLVELLPHAEKIAQQAKEQSNR